MNPLWIFPIYPLLLTGPMAGAVAPSQSQSHALIMGIAGFAFQGIGFMIALMIYSAYIYRLMTKKLPGAPSRPGMFISVGPSAFTVIGIVNMGQAASGALGDVWEDGKLLAKVVEMGTLMCGIWLWGLSCWFFLVSLAANAWAAEMKKLHFTLGFWSFIFPNTAFVLATFASMSTASFVYFWGEARASVR
jgi:tellurite resistance protein TehA-like permease